MRQCLTFLFLVCTAWALQSQTTDVTVSGTVTTTDGDPVEDVTILIFTDSLPSNFIYSNSVTTDAQGQYSDAFSLPDNFTQGALFVSMADCNGYYITQTIFWNPGNTGLTVDFIYCDVQDFCDVYVSATGSGVLLANPTGVAPYSYQWSNGATTQEIAPNAPGLYCVTVADASGCTAISCYDSGYPIDSLCSVYISLEGNTGAGLLVEAVASGAPPYTYAWSTGETTHTIVITTSGQYCVTITDSGGCTASSCVQANVLPCEVDILVDSSSLIAIPTGEAPFAYNWSNGSTGASVTPDTDGQYCVTITDADGCQSSACYYWSTAIDTSCYVYIVPVQGGALLEAVADGTFPFAYSWNTGATTQWLPINAAGGVYCVTVTDAIGCQSSACYPAAPVENYRVQGYVYLVDSTSSGLLQGDVYLIQYDDGAGTLTALDTVPLLSNAFGSGSYDFGDVPAGEYLIKAALSPTSMGYADNLPTYYGNSLWWDEATTVSTPFSGAGYFNIVLVEGDNPGGPGFIGGLVTDGANFSSGQLPNRSGGPLVGASIILLDEFDQPVTYTYTNENGEFEFPSLAWGTYKVVLEIPGHNQAHYLVTLGPDNPAIHGLNFEVTEAGILNVDGEELAASLSLFPVPAQGRLAVQFESKNQGEVQLFISDYSGRILQKQQLDVQPGAQQFTLDISRLPAGIYTLGIRAKDGVNGKQFLKSN